MAKLDHLIWLDNLAYHHEEDPDVLPKGFEANFLTDVHARSVDDPGEFFISGKMLNILKRIGEDRFGMKWNQYEGQE